MENGTAVDEDEIFQACDNGTVFVFLQGGESFDTSAPSGSVPSSGSVLQDAPANPSTSKPVNQNIPVSKGNNKQYT